MKNITILSILLSLSLSACGISEKVMATHIAETMAAIPTATLIPTPTPEPTPTKIPLSSIPLKDILIDNEDYLPTGYSYGQFRSEAPQMFVGIRKATNIVYAQFAHKDDTSGGVVIFVYDNAEDADSAFDMIYREFGDTGKMSSMDTIKTGTVTLDFSYMVGGLQSVDVVMQECNVVYHARVSDTTDDLLAKYYLQQIVLAMRPFVCD